MSLRNTLIKELENALGRQTDGARAVTLRRITDLFLSAADRFDAQQLQLFNDIMLRLIEKIEARAIVELSERLAPVANAPAGVVGHLARLDDIGAAGPILAQSERLNQADLLDIAEIKGQEHLLAIASRKQIDIPVTDTLVKRGNTDVVRRVASNPGAKLSEGSFGNLVELAAKDDVVAEHLVQRTDIPSHLIHRMLMRATDAVRKRLLAAAPPETQPEIQRIIDKIAADIIDDSAPDADFAAVKQRITADRPDGKLTEKDVLGLAQTKKMRETVVGLSLLCSVPVTMVEELMNDERIEPILIMCKAGGFEWPTVRAVVQLRARSREGGGALTEICENYRKLQTPSARQVLSYWQTRAGGRAP
jgi:uncharacterized protein (DUF2336 family)